MYTFIKKNTFGENIPTPVLAISTKIETLRKADTYDHSGQIVGHYDAGDYCFDNDASSAILDCLQDAKEERLINNAVEVLIIDNLVDDLYGDNQNCDKDKLQEFINEWRKENESFNEVRGFNYWNGHNWQTVTVEVDQWEPTHYIVNDGIDYNKIIEDKTFVNESFGKELYETEDYYIIQTRFADDFSSYQIFDKQEFDLENLY